MTLPEPGSLVPALGPGDTLGRYELLLPVAEGGMALVWAARLRGTRGFSKTVAIKTMLPELSADPQFEKMFLDEARIASGIRHPNVAEILELGEERGQLYLVLEWIDGEALANLRRDAVRSGGMPLGVAVRIVAGVCAGLHAAHELRDEYTGQNIGLVHRDISPQNVLVTFDGVVKVVDFGVAKAAGRSVDKTLAGHVKGKPPYMSPEQASGMDVDRRTDIFALGILLYQLVTGKHPFRGESDLVTLQNIVSNKSVVPPRAYNSECPKQLERVISKAIEHHAEDRFATAHELGQALEECLPELPCPRQDDVVRFVQRASGERGERRRQLIREAIALAEERSGDTGTRTLSGPVPRLAVGIDPHGLTVSGGRGSRGEEVTQLAAPVRSGSTPTGMWWLGAAVAAVLGLLLLTRTTETPVAANRLEMALTAESTVLAPTVLAAVPTTPAGVPSTAGVPTTPAGVPSTAGVPTTPTGVPTTPTGVQSSSMADVPTGPIDGEGVLVGATESAPRRPSAVRMSTKTAGRRSVPDEPEPPRGAGSSDRAFVPPPLENPGF